MGIDNDFTDSDDLDFESLDLLVSDAKKEVGRILQPYEKKVDFKKIMIEYLLGDEGDPFPEITDPPYTIDGAKSFVGGSFDPQTNIVTVGVLKEDFEKIEKKGLYSNNSLVLTTTAKYFSIILHELIHTQQDSNVDSAVLEIATRYYLDKYLEKNDLIGCTFYDNRDWEELLKKYDELSSQFGNDLGKYVLGTLTDKGRREEIEEKLKEVFNDAFLNSQDGIAFYRD